MGIGIRGIKVTSVSIDLKGDEDKIQGNYALMSTNDKVLATQSFNGYSDIKIAFSAETLKAFNTFLAGVKNDINNVLGLQEE